MKARKQKWKEKQLYGYFKWQIKDDMRYSKRKTGKWNWISFNSSTKEWTIYIKANIGNTERDSEFRLSEIKQFIT